MPDRPKPLSAEEVDALERSAVEGTIQDRLVRTVRDRERQRDRNLVERDKSEQARQELVSRNALLKMERDELQRQLAEARKALNLIIRTLGGKG